MMKIVAAAYCLSCFFAGSLFMWTFLLKSPNDTVRPLPLPVQAQPCKSVPKPIDVPAPVVKHGRYTSRWCKQLKEVQEWNWNKTVLSYAMYKPVGQEMPAYLLNGARKASELSNKFYPGSIVRLYVTNLEIADLKDVYNLPNVEVWQCEPNSNPVRMMEYRFLAIDDPKVSILMCRDLDSLIELREMLAVNEWLASGYLFHAMHDHFAHSIPVIGCCWGARRGAFGPGFSMEEYIAKVWKKYPHSSMPACCGEDQGILTNLWHEGAGKVAINHQQNGLNLCFGAAKCLPFPMSVRTDSNFIGYQHKASSQGDYVCHSTCDWVDPTVTAAHASF